MNRIKKLIKKANENEEIALQALLEIYDEEEAEQKLEKGDYFVFSSNDIDFAKEYIDNFQPSLKDNVFYPFLDFSKYGEYIKIHLEDDGDLINVDDKIVWIFEQ